MDAVDEIRAQWARERPDLDTWPMGIIGRFTRLNRLIERELRDFFARYGMERWEFDMLATLRRAGGEHGLTAGDLNKAAMVTSGATTNRIDRLTAKGLVERAPDPEDRRSIRVRLTPEGRRLVDEIVGLHVANEERFLEILTPAERSSLEGTLRRLLEALGDTSLS
ncbi:MarR family transcriptional regulator [Spirillospora sp. NPDC047279]|uniref:MarR family winged helix-turn-helix transcriptional regulator n=1 Tax=Spirillospora sp. NPDC047279 TaxID=3155478 RepID=UPI0033D56893